MELQGSSLTFSYGEKKVIKKCDLTLKPGRLTVITGPNGSGKSTLVNLLGGFLQADAGELLLDNRPLNSFTDSERACRIGVLTQERKPALAFSAAERIMMGRFVHLPRLSAPGEKDKAELYEAVRTVGIEALINRPCNQLSGGEYQKVLIAALLARQTQIMLLDEPTAALDPAGALHVMRIMAAKKHTAAVGIVTHDLALAAQFADQLLLMKEGTVFAAGTPSDVLTVDNIRAVYNCDAEIVGSSSGPVVIFR
jgi:iron complex transport system ATP-binding protein